MLLKVFVTSESSRNECTPLFLDHHHIGFIRADIWQEIRRFGHIFAMEKYDVHKRRVRFLLDLKNDYNNSVERFEQMLVELRDEKRLVSLHGWRFEASSEIVFW